MAGEQLPIYGDGRPAWDWLHVGDHYAAIIRQLEAGRSGGIYYANWSCKRANIDLFTLLCCVLDDEEQP